MKGWTGFIIGLTIGLGVVAVVLVVTRPTTPTAKLIPSARPTAVRASQSYMNKEKWVWTDWKGRNRNITVERDARIV